MTVVMKRSTQFERARQHYRRRGRNKFPAVNVYNRAPMLKKSNRSLPPSPTQLDKLFNVFMWATYKKNKIPVSNSILQGKSYTTNRPNPIPVLGKRGRNTAFSQNNSRQKNSSTNNPIPVLGKRGRRITA